MSGMYLRQFIQKTSLVQLEAYTLHMLTLVAHIEMVWLDQSLQISADATRERAMGDFWLVATVQMLATHLALQGHNKPRGYF